MAITQITSLSLVDDAVTAPRIADGAILRSKIEQPELVTNPNFTSNLSGWTDNSGSGSNIAHSSDFGGCMLMSGSTAYAKADQQIATVVGVAYTLSVTVDDLTASHHNVSVYLGTSSGGTQIQNVAIREGRAEFRFIATSTATFIRIQTGYNSVKVGSVSCRREASAGRILQVVQAFKDNTFSTTTYNSWIDIIGLSLNITPASTSSTILLTAYIGCMADTRLNLSTVFRFMRGSTAIGVGEAAGNRPLATFGGQNVMADANHGTSKGAATYLDSPNSTSQQTYKLQMNTQSGGSHTIYINRTVNDGDSANNYLARRSSGIIAMEVAP